MLVVTGNLISFFIAGGERVKGIKIIFIMILFMK